MAAIAGSISGIKESTELVWMVHRVSRISFELKNHYEFCYQIVMVLDGRVRYQIGESSYEVAPGEIVILNALEEHYLEVLEYPYERYVLQMNTEFFQKEVRVPEIISLFIRRPANFHHVIKPSVSCRDEVMKCISELEKEYEGNEKFREKMMGSLLRHMFIRLYRDCEETLPAESTNSHLKMAFRIREYLEQHYTEHVTVGDIAEKLSFSADHVSRIFRQAMGYGINEYIITLRLFKAKALLSQTDKSVSAIAEECGYSDVNFFTKQFKSKVGSTPRQFRKTAGGSRNFEQ